MLLSTYRIFNILIIILVRFNICNCQNADIFDASSKLLLSNTTEPLAHRELINNTFNKSTYQHSVLKSQSLYKLDSTIVIGPITSEY